MIHWDFAVNFFVALFALLDPIGNVPVFAASTVERTEGYALTNAEVRRALDRNDNSRRPASVGGCAV